MRGCRQLLTIGLAAGTRIWIAAGRDGHAAGIRGAERDGADGAGGESVFGASVCVSREARRSAQAAVRDGDGLYSLANGWNAESFTGCRERYGVSLTLAQLSMLLEGIDWRRPVRSYAPQMAVSKTVRFSCPF